MWLFLATAFFVNGQAGWDKRVKMMEEDVVSRTQHFEKLRAGLNSK
jgi:hypothetical protein